MPLNGARGLKCYIAMIGEINRQVCLPHSVLKIACDPIRRDWRTKSPHRSVV